MKKKFALILISSILTGTSVSAVDFAFTEPADFTGEAFFTPPTTTVEKTKSSKKSNGAAHTLPPIKLLRLKLQEKKQIRDARNYELAPTAEDIYTGEVETSEYASKEVVDNFDEEMINPDGFESEAEVGEEPTKNKKTWFKKKDKKTEDTTENIILDCENVDYDAPNYLVKATGNVNVEFVKQGINVKADIITFDRINNTIKAEGDVKILKGSQVITGDYIFVDMNEENALIENPKTNTATIEIRSKKGYVYGDKIVQEDGSIKISESFPINYYSARRGPQMRRMLVPKGETLAEEMESGIIKFKAQDIKITQKGEHETISITHGRLFKGDKSILKIPSIKIYTNKNHDYGETDHWEVGAYRGLGVYAGPGVVFELPKGSVLKAMPILNYKSGFGIGGLGRFNSGTNQTMIGYGTAQSKFVIYGKQELDDNLYLQYGVNSYMNEWFLGRRRPKYGASIVYQKRYSTEDFLLKGKEAGFTHRLEGGYFQDLDFDNNFEKINGTNMGTTRFRYMAEGRQNLFNYEDKEALKAFKIGIMSQLSTALYGTGDTQVIGRLGPSVHLQYKRWMQTFGYFFSVYDDNTPMPVYDAYRYGKQNLYLREYFRLCKWLTVSWFGSINVTGDSPNDKTFQENSFYFSIGPDDIKLNLGYDFTRRNLYCLVELMTDAKGASVEYETLEIKQDKKAEKKSQPKPVNAYQAPSQPKILQKAVVEDVKVIEDVL